MDRPASVRGALTEAKGIAAGIPDMLVEARRVAATVLAGWHGRRVSGRGETFWQFRPFTTGEPAASIDWRRSARDDHLYVREKEWEAAHTVWLWVDLSASMDFRSRLAPVGKRTRAGVLMLALAELLASAGERTGLLGASNPILSRNAAERIAAFVPGAAAKPAPPDTRPLKRFSDVVLIGDFLDPMEEIEKTLDAILRAGTHAHLVQVIDPIEETFPYAGRTEFRDPETGIRHVVSRAEHYREDYGARLTALRDRLSTLCRRLDWTFLIHRTDRPATEPLLALHARLADRQSRRGVDLSRPRRMTALAFTNAGMLVALAALPVIWYFLRLMPPKPRLEQFPPTRLLLEIARKEEQPARSPWWLTALRLLLAAAVIVALAGPVFKPTGEVAPGTGPLLLVVDNGWASGPHWPAMLDTAHRVVHLAEDAGRPIALLATAEPANQLLTPTDSAAILKRLDALTPRPWAARRGDFVAPLTEAAAKTPFGGVAWVSDGLGGAGVDTFARFLGDNSKEPVVVYADRSSDLFGLKPPTGTADALAVPVIRRPAPGAAAGLVTARDIKGRVIGDAPFSFVAGETSAEAKLTLPIEIRNEIVRVEVTGSETAGAVQLLDDRWRRRRIGLLSGASVEAAQPLLSPLYYISRAVQPFADIREPRDANASVAVPDLIDANSSVIAMADIGKLTPDVEELVAKWVRDGGTLVRFAGPRLAAATDALIPVEIRHGDRTLGGSLSWQTPQPLASLSDKSPFAGLPVPDDVLVNRQVLAEPDGALADRTWAALADGTPLVTAAQQGKGWLILFHVTADTSWSNLPLSGTFVEMLRRIIAFSAGASGGNKNADATQPIAPYRLLDGYGHFTAPGAEARPLAGDVAAVEPGIEHPPGLYGSEAGFRALNLLGEKAELPAFDISNVARASVRPYPTATPTEFGPWLIALAVLLLMLDALAVLWLGGAFRIWRRAAAAIVFLAAAGMLLHGAPVRADEAGDKFALEAVGKTHLAYVVTGNADVDATSRAGLAGLSQALSDRTALEPGDPIGVSPDRDELAFFPLIYWPIVPDTAMPSPATMARIDAYMRQGGSVLFDTRDQLERSASPNSFAGTPAVERLRDMLANLDIPPLEPVPADHVLTKAFYLLNDFPGRYAGGPLWVQASDSEERSDRPVQAGDGVSTILITENDFAAAWAKDSRGNYLFPTVPTDPLQREMAYRTGINIVMYTLTGNYKADQVHVPALLERLGQ